MGTYKQGILGSFIGKVGTVVGSTWRGIAVMRSLASKVANPRTAAQVAVRNRLAAVSKTLRPFLETIRRGFIASGTAPSWSLAIKVNREKTLPNDQGVYILRPEDIVLSNGTDNFPVTATLNGTSLSLSWDAPDMTDDLFGANIQVAVLNATNGKVANFSVASSAGEASLSTSSVITGDDDDKLHLYHFAANDTLSTLTIHQAL